MNKRQKATGYKAASRLMVWKDQKELDARRARVEAAALKSVREATAEMASRIRAEIAKLPASASELEMLRAMTRAFGVTK